MSIPDSPTRCGKVIMRGCMTEPRLCVYSAGHIGRHSPDLTDMRFGNLLVVKPGQPYIVAKTGSRRFTWDCVDTKGRARPNIDVHGLLCGDSRGLYAPKDTGTITIDGYRRVQRKGKSTYEHRDVMSKILGRPLLPTETVHHGPKGRVCNDPDNLSLRLKGNHPSGHSIEEPADWLRSLGCCVSIPVKLRSIASGKL